MLKPVRKVNHDRCNICDSDKGLVYGSIMYGSICNKCIETRFNRNNSGKLYMNNMEQMPEFEYRALYESPYAKGISTALMDIYGRYQAKLTNASIDNSGNVLIQLDSKYKNSDCVISVWTTNSNIGLTVVYNIVNKKSNHEILSRVFRIQGDKVFIDIPDK